MDLLYWVLLNNFCTFNNKTYLQIKGTAMGTPVATSYANIFLFGIECDVIEKHKPYYYKRHIDDIFAIYPSKMQAKCFIHTFNNVVPSIELEAITIGRQGIMLDLEIELMLDSSSSSSSSTKAPATNQQPVGSIQDQLNSLYLMMLNFEKNYRVPTK